MRWINFELVWASISKIEGWGKSFSRFYTAYPSLPSTHHIPSAPAELRRKCYKKYMFSQSCQFWYSKNYLFCIKVFIPHCFWIHAGCSGRDGQMDGCVSSIRRKILCILEDDKLVLNQTVLLCEIKTFMRPVKVFKSKLFVHTLEILTRPYPQYLLRLKETERN